jgi:glycosyltransferase involved in cell wall biosynthesis
LKVAHVHRIRGIGGSERHLLALLPALAELGAEPVLVGLDDPRGEPEPFYRALRVPSVRLSNPRDLDPLLLGRLVRALRADVVHTHLVHADAYGGLAARLRGALLVSTKHNDDPFRAGAFRYVERGLTRLAARVVTITESLRRFNVERVGLPEQKLEVIHYGLDAPPEPWGENPPDPVPRDANVLLAVARLVPQKGIDVALRALVELPDAWLVVLGEGPERGRLETLAGELGVDGRVWLPGRVPDVAAWLRRANVLVHPARWEGFGLALLEAMLCGKPVVATRVSSIPEIVADGETGILVPPDDPHALADAVRRIEPHLGDAGRERARTEFSVARMTRRTLDLYERVASASV